MSSELLHVSENLQYVCLIAGLSGMTWFNDIYVKYGYYVSLNDFFLVFLWSFISNLNFVFILSIIIYFFLFLSSLFSTKFWLLISTGTWRDMSWGGLSICKFYFALLFLQFYFHFDFLCLFFHKICIYIYLVKVILAMGEWVLYRVLQKGPQSIYFSFNLGSL